MCAMGQSGSPTTMRPAGAPPAAPRPADVMPRVARSEDPMVSRYTAKDRETDQLVGDIRMENAGKTAAKMDATEQGAVPNRAAKGDREDRGGPTVVESIAPDQAPERPPVNQPARPVSKTPPQVQDAEAGPADYEERQSPSVIAKKGDSLSRIAKKAGVPVSEVIAANPQLRDPDKIRIGQRIFLPRLKME